MDAFDVVRRRAEAVRRGSSLDPEAKGLEVARALAEAEGYDPIALDSDDPLLQGAEAVLDRGVEAIFYRGSESDAEAAALIAHELGHLHLHGGLSWCHAQDLAGELDERPGDDTSETRGDETRAEVGTAVHRLESYGARERQELQANVFARELLLPRSTARRLFRADGLGARQIAERLALPLELVRQQLSDALLLPETDGETTETATDETATDETAEDREPTAPELDDSQRAAAEHLGSPLLLEAGPGTGKTRTLVGRVLFLMGRGVDPSSILALTFSNKAAQEIVERVSRHAGDAGASLFAGTFHAFGLEILRKHHDRVGLGPDLRVVDRADSIALLEERLPILDLVHHQNLYEPALALKEITSAISRAKDELVDAAGYLALAEAMHERAGTEEARLEAERALEVARVYGVYESELRDRGWADFGDLVMLPTLLLEKEPAVRATLRLRYRHVLVDEYQDVNRAGARLLKALAGDGARLWVVGDSRQSIYRFRGASTANMRLFERDFPGAARRALGVSYRSAEAVVRTFQSFASGMKASEGMLPLDLEAHRGDVADGPGLREAADADEEVAAVAGRVRELASAGVALRDQAVLCRSNGQVERFARGFAARGVPVLHLGSLFERSEIRDLLSILQLVVDPRGGSLARLAAVPEYAIPAADVRLFLDAVAGTLPGAETSADDEEKPAEPVRYTALSVLRKLAGLPDEDARREVPDAVAESLRDALGEDARRGFLRLARDLADASPRHTPWGILATYLFDRADALRREPSGSPLDDRMREVAIHQFLGFVKGARAGGRGFPAKRLLDRIRRLVLLGEERDLRQMPAAALHLDAVRLMTLHGSKGLEFEAVHLPGLSTGGLPSSFRRARCPPPEGLITEADGADEDLERKDLERSMHEAEEECLFFVAVSRARTHLSFFRSRTAGRQNRRPSAFLARLDPPPPVVEASPIPPVDDPASERLPLEGRELLRHTRDRDLRAYERCPRRFFYGTLFRLPGDRRESAYQETTSCLYRMLDWLGASRDDADDAEVAERLEEIWRDSGPVGHAFETPYRELLGSLVEVLVGARRELEPLEADPDDPEADPRPSLELDLGGPTVELTPDLAGRNEAGVAVMRLVRAAREGSFKAEDVSHALWQQAAHERFGAGARVEVVHLADGGRTPVALTAKKLQYRLEKGRDLVSGLADGRFPADPDPVKCPRCPYFFVCPTVPGGPITLRPDPETAQEENPAPSDEAKEKSLGSALPVPAVDGD